MCLSVGVGGTTDSRGSPVGRAGFKQKPCKLAGFGLLSAMATTPEQNNRVGTKQTPLRSQGLGLPQPALPALPFDFVGSLLLRWFGGWGLSEGDSQHGCLWPFYHDCGHILCLSECFSFWNRVIPGGLQLSFKNRF